MSAHFEKIAVKEVRKETDDCVSVSFDIPEHLQEKFSYRHGQHLTLRTHINGEEVRRSYSLCSSPLHREWRIAVKKLSGGLFSSFVNQEIKPGSMLEVMPPLGNFSVELHPENKKRYIGIAAGSGITPVISIIKTIFEVEPFSEFILIYSNRNRNSIIFREELEGLKNKYINRFSIFFILTREKTDIPINYGRLNAQKCEELFGKAVPLKADEFFVCGPEEMIFSVRDFLLDKKVDKKKIHFELFTASGENKLQVRRQPANVSTSGSKIVVKLDGRYFDFQLPFNSDDSVLDAALKQGVDLPFACKGGVCCTCKAKLLEGQVEMDVNYGLEEEEVQQGFILTCQSHPVTETVVVDYDVK